MKLVLAIVSKDDSSMVSSALTQEGFPVTKLATTGGFLMAGNTTFISGVEDGQVDQVIDIIRKQSAAAPRLSPAHPPWTEVCIHPCRSRSPWAVRRSLCWMWTVSKKYEFRRDSL